MGDPTPARDAAAELAACLDVALPAIEAAGNLALRWFRTEVGVEDKRTRGVFDPVTRADREVETALRDAIAASFPEHAVIGEEGGRSGGGRVEWLIDPIDGTRAFITGSPLWGILLGLVIDGVPRAGVMHQPFLGETWLGTGDWAVLRAGNGERVLATRATAGLGRAIVGCTDPGMFVTADEQAAFGRVEARARLVRYGGDCYGYCLLALGFLDAVVENGLQAYDIVPLIPIIEGAGGIVTDRDGRPPARGGFVVAAATAALHAEILGLLAAGEPG